MERSRCLAVQAFQSERLGQESGEFLPMPVSGTSAQLWQARKVARVLALDLTFRPFSCRLDPQKTT